MTFKIEKMKILYLFLFLLIPEISDLYAQQNEVYGRIETGTSEDLRVNIHIPTAAMGTFSEEDGSYSIENVPPGKHRIRISLLGYKTLEKSFSISAGEKLELNFSLEISYSKLEAILIVDRQLGITRKTPYNIAPVALDKIENKSHPSGIMGVLREVPGVYGAEFGQGIVKPFIRGLGFSRVVTIYQGNKLENHQWGGDHGLGINDLGISRVDVIKGPASVLYGSGALGGVLLSRDDEFYLYSDKFSGKAGSNFNSVSNGFRSYGSVGTSFPKGTFLAADLARETHADYRDGDGRLIGNSRFNTSTLRLHTGLKKENFQNKLSFTYNEQKLGIISDEEMQEGESFATTINDRSMQLPFQEVQDYLLSYNQTGSNENFETALHVSHHLNTRREIESAIDEVDLGLTQNHNFYNLRVGFPGQTLKHNFGIQGSYITTRNFADANEFLIPDARIFENGFYYLGSLELEDYFIQGALRYDYREVLADAGAQHFVEDGFILPGDPESRRIKSFFKGFTGSLGLSYKVNTRQNLKFNFSTGFRAPDLAELYSNGVHPGTSRFETGNSDFSREQSYQADISYTYSSKNLKTGISGFASKVADYIFFASTGEIRGDGLEVWSYNQTDAGIYGMEISADWAPFPNLSLELDAALLRGKDLINGDFLTFMPPDNLNLQANLLVFENTDTKLFAKSRLVARQDRPGFEEMPTPGYALFDLGITHSFSIGKNSLEGGLTAYNVFNKTYVDHLSLLRAFDVPSPGRNLLLNLRYIFR